LAAVASLSLTPLEKSRSTRLGRAASSTATLVEGIEERSGDDGNEGGVRDARRGKGRGGGRWVPRQCGGEEVCTEQVEDMVESGLDGVQVGVEGQHEQVRGTTEARCLPRA
jgi:hypothetical protein